MTAPLLSPRQEGRARLLAREIGNTVRRERRRRGDSLADIARYLGMKVYTRSNGNLSNFERNPKPNMMLGKAVSLLNLYGYTLAVVPLRKPE